MTLDAWIALTIVVAWSTFWPWWIWRKKKPEPPSPALTRLIKDMKEAGLWDYERGCPKGCEDPTKWELK